MNGTVKSPRPGDAALAALLMALHGHDGAPDGESVEAAMRRLVFSKDGLTLIKYFSPCSKTNLNAFPAQSRDWLEGRRSVLADMVRLALREPGAEKLKKENKNG